MTSDVLLRKLFPRGFSLERAQEDFFTGTAPVAGETLRMIGTANAAEVGVDLALRLAQAVLDTVRSHPGQPILFLLDTRGQRLRRRDELLGLNGYMAHLAKCVALARSRGHPILSLVYGQAVSGGYLTTGMMADGCYALADAEIKVMNLPAMARITKIPLERLQDLAERSPVFSPGAENYYRMGHLTAIWQGNLAARLDEALRQARAMPSLDDVRMTLGRERGGRTRAAEVAERILRHG